jgi:hypothetical protein
VGFEILPLGQRTESQYCINAFVGGSCRVIELIKIKTMNTDLKKELLDFIKSLNNRGLLSVGVDSFDYEWVIWDYLKKKTDCQHEYYIEHIVDTGKSVNQCVKCLEILENL